VVGNLNDGCTGIDPATPTGIESRRPVDWEPVLDWPTHLRQSKTVLRMMGGVYPQQRVGGGTTGGNLVNNPPANRSLSVGPCAGCTIDNLSNVLGGALFSPGTINAVEVSSHHTHNLQLTLGVQQDIASNGDGSQLRWLTLHGSASMK